MSKKTRIVLVLNSAVLLIFMGILQPHSIGEAIGIIIGYVVLMFAAAINGLIFLDSTLGQMVEKTRSAAELKQTTST